MSQLSGQAEGICPAQCQDPQQILGESCASHTLTRVKGQTSVFHVLPCISMTVSAVHSAVVMAICEDTGRMNSETDPFKHFK